MTTPRGSFVAGYDSAGRLETIAGSDGGGPSYTYDGSLPLSETRPPSRRAP